MAMEKRVLFRSAWLPWVLIAPQLAIIGIFFFLPAGQAVLQSFQVEDAFGMSREWVGLENFRQLWDNPDYLGSFQRTALFSVLVAGIGIVVSLALAIFADRIVRFAMVYKTLLIVPYAVAPVIAGVLWVFLFSPSIGVVTYYLGKLGYGWNHLMNENQAMALIVLASVWKQISYNFLFFLAGLQSIPKALIEAASIDGAGPWRRLWSITLPQLNGTTTLVVVLQVIASLKVFDQMFIAFNGGPGPQGSTRPILQYVYDTGFTDYRVGYASAISYVYFALIIVITIVLQLIIRRRNRNV